MDSELDQLLLSKIPADGTAIGNTKLLRALPWNEEQYWEVRNRLVDRGLIETGRGRGGSVRRVITALIENMSAAPFENTSAESIAARARESALYEPLARVLEDRWVKDRRFESAIVQITALQGRRLTGGKWSRPDIAAATLSTYPYVPGRHFDVVTFEVKPADGVDVTAVYEALAHLRAATRAYVLLCIPDDQRAGVEDEIDEISAVARKHGVGLITIADPSNYDTWDELVESERVEPDPQRLNDFLAAQFNAEQREKLLKWFR